MDNIIYFNAGGKSFDVIEIKHHPEVWYEWVEHRKNFMVKMFLSWKVMLWICGLLHIASEGRRNELRRWRTRDHLFNFFCIKKFNNYGRFISIVTIQGEHRAVIMLPKISFNEGWKELELKIERFINRDVSHTKVGGSSFVKDSQHRH